MPNSSEKRQSWWKRHCTAPPPVTRNVMCPCTSCWQTTAVYEPTTNPSQRPSVSPTSSFSSASSRSSRIILGRKRLDIDSDTTPLFRQNTDYSTRSDARPRQSDEISLATVVRGRETL